MKFYHCLNELCALIGCTFDTAFLIGLWGFAFLVHFSIVFLTWFVHLLKVRLQNRKKDR